MSELQCRSNPCTVVLVLAQHPTRSEKFEGVSLCDLWVIAGGWVITLHVFACPYHQILLANYSNTPVAWGVLQMHAVVSTSPVRLACLKKATHHIPHLNDPSSVLTQANTWKSAILHSRVPHVTLQHTHTNRDQHWLSNNTKIILISQELTLISDMQS
jgi:hypothetical protein